MEEKKNLKKKRKKMMEMEMVNEQINSNEKKKCFHSFYLFGAQFRMDFDCKNIYNKYLRIRRFDTIRSKWME